VINHSCNLTFQINQSELGIVQDTCSIFQNASITEFRFEDEVYSVPFSSRNAVGYLRACSQDLVLNISKQLTNFQLDKLNFNLSLREKNSQEEVPNKCDYPVLEIWEKKHVTFRKNANKFPSQLSRNARHVNHSSGRIRSKSRIWLSRRRPSVKVLKRQSKHCRQSLQFFVEKRRLIRRYRKTLLAKDIRRIVRKSQRRCSKLSKKRNKRDGIANKTYSNQPHRNRSGSRPRKTRSLSTKKWIKSIQLCQVDDPNGSLTLNVLSKDNAIIKTQR